MSIAHYAKGAATAERMRRRLRRSGMTARGDRLWTDEEKTTLVRLRGDYKAMEIALPHRTPVAIKAACQKLGLRKQIKFWKSSEISLLRRLYPKASAAQIMEAFPGASWVNIRQVARYHGFRRKGRAYKLTGIQALDEVRRRCFEINWTMRDLDQAARTKTYFQRCGWIGKKINHRALGRAIEALDGVVQAKWN